MAYIIFMGAFFAVLTTVAATFAFALWRSRRALAANRAEEIRWHSDFHDLAPADRACRHVLTGEFARRECPNAFDCRGCQTHAKLIAKHPPAAAREAEDEIFGMPFPLDRFYHRGHTWTRLEPDGLLTVGLDELGRRLVGAPDAVDLPQSGTRLHANGTAFHMRKRGADVRVLSPVAGEVVETGGAGQGWYLRVRPASLDLTHLLRGAEVRPWLMRELERLQLTLSAEGAPALADGGVPVDDISAAYPATDWDAVCGTMFLEP
jgi:glycine cleavage system H lipoate-binding protein